MVRLRDVGRQLGLHRNGGAYFGIVKRSYICLSESQDAINLQIEAPNVSKNEIGILCNKLKTIFAQKIYFLKNRFHIRVDLSGRGFRLSTESEIVDYISYCVQAVASDLTRRSDLCMMCRKNEEVQYYTLDGEGYMICDNCMGDFRKKELKMKHSYNYGYRSYLRGGFLGGLFGLVLVVISSFISKYYMTLSLWIIFVTPIFAFAGYTLVEKEKGRYTVVVYIINTLINIFLIAIFIPLFNGWRLGRVNGQGIAGSKLNLMLVVSVCSYIVSAMVTLLRARRMVFFENARSAKMT